MTVNFEALLSLCKPIDVSGPEPERIGTLTQDSRQVKEGSVFIAVKGTQVDGHMFIDNAVTRGASVIICEESFYSEEYDICIIEVSDTRSLVGPLAQAFEDNPAKKLVITGITGTNGKTTVATLVYQALQDMGAKPSLLGTVAKRINDRVLESLLTTSDPIELASDMRKMVVAGSTHLVMEVSSHALDQQRVDGIDFQVAAFTNLSHDHLDYHEDAREYAKAKKKLFDGLDSEAWAIVNADDPKSKFIVMDCPARIVDFSFTSEMSVQCELISNTTEGLKLSIDGTEISSPLVGKFNAYNVAEAFLICRALGYGDKDIAAALKHAEGAAGRLQRVHSGQPLILVDYAHTPDALDNVLETLSGLKQPGQELWVVFGCGGNRDKSKRPIMAQIAEMYADHVVVTSDNPRKEDPEEIIEDIMAGFEEPGKVKRVADRRRAITETVAKASKDSIILIAGKGHETYQEVQGVRHDFDDRKIAKEALASRIAENTNGEVA